MSDRPARVLEALRMAGDAWLSGEALSGQLPGAPLPGHQNYVVAELGLDRLADRAWLEFKGDVGELLGGHLPQLGVRVDPRGVVQDEVGRAEL